MSDRDKTEADASTDEEQGSESASSHGPRAWKELWQIPVLAVGMALIIAGLMTARAKAPGADFDGALDSVEIMMSRKELDQSLTQLNDVILPKLEDNEVTTAQRRRFHLLRGDVIFKLQRAHGLKLEENYEAVINEYEAAIRFLAQLDSTRRGTYAQALLAIGRIDDALEQVRKLPDSDADLRRELLKKVIHQTLAGDGERLDLTLQLLQELQDEPGLTADDRMWIVAREADVRLQDGRVEEALSFLLRSMQRFDRLNGRDAGEMYLLLAKAYFKLRQIDEARRRLELALQELPPGDPLTGEAHILAGRIAVEAGDLVEARDHFRIVTEEHQRDAAALLAWLGLGDVEANLGDFTESLKAFSQAVSLIASLDEAGVTPADVTERLLRWQRDRFSEKELKVSLRYAMLARSLYASEEKTPSSVLLALAQTNRALGDEILARARPEPGGPTDLSAVDPATRAEARAKYAQAGDDYLRRARAELLKDEKVSADSLWRAADNYDLAGDYERAIETFNEYATGRPDDPRQPEAKFRQARAEMALGRFDDAAPLFEEVVKSNPRSPEASRSLVPLARCYTLNASADDDDKAAPLLETVVTNGRLGPEAIEFRDALIELGRLMLYADQLPEAIRRLSEAEERYPDDPRVDSVRFNLAEAQRRRATQIALSLADPMPETRRTKLKKLRTERLEGALSLYERVRTSMDEIDPDAMTSMQRIMLRNSLFYRADCAYDLARYPAAIAFYDEAAQRYADDPASLVALIQIVNAYVQEKAWREARTANERAKARLKELPDEAFADATLPLDRRHWERWLDSRSLINQQAAVNP